MSNGFSAEDMSTAAARGHADGYQAGYADAVKAFEAAQPAAAQEAVARQTMATCPRDGTVVLLHFGEDHVSPGWWDAPCAPVQNFDGTWPSDMDGFPWAFFDLRDGTAFVNHAVDTEYGPTHWSVYATPVAAAPVDVSRVLEFLLHVRKCLDKNGEYSPLSRSELDGAIAAIEGDAETLAQVDAFTGRTPAAPGIDLTAAEVGVIETLLALA